MNAEWTTWKEKFCETFTNKGWSAVKSALLFKYKEGSLLDYAIKKEKLLLEMRKSIDTGTMIDLIAAGLPEFVINKIDREKIQDAAGLFNEVSKYENMMGKKSYSSRKKYDNVKMNNKSEEYTPCKICEKLNKGVRYHPEAACWFKTMEAEKVKKHNIRHVNNTTIEAELNELDQKN